MPSILAPPRPETEPGLADDGKVQCVRLTDAGSADHYEGLPDSAVVGWLWQAIVLFTVTKIDDLIVLALRFARARALWAAW